MYEVHDVLVSASTSTEQTACTSWLHWTWDTFLAPLTLFRRMDCFQFLSFFGVFAFAPELLCIVLLWHGSVNDDYTLPLQMNLIWVGNQNFIALTFSGNNIRPYVIPIWYEIKKYTPNVLMTFNAVSVLCVFVQIVASMLTHRLHDMPRLRVFRALPVHGELEWEWKRCITMSWHCRRTK